MNLSHLQRDTIAEKVESDWIMRADKLHGKLPVSSPDYRLLESEFFIGAAGVLQSLAIMHDQPPQSYIPRHWLTNPLTGHNIVAPYRVHRLSHRALIERATKMMSDIIPCDKFGKDLAVAYIADTKDEHFREWVKALPEGA